eukprot:scaffold27891_cov291-Skeletonema_menzelii.AAC.1
MPGNMRVTTITLVTRKRPKWADKSTRPTQIVGGGPIMLPFVPNYDSSKPMTSKTLSSKTNPTLSTTFH